MTAILYQGRPIDLARLRIGEELKLPKRHTILGSEFEETILGDLKGARTQYRGPLNSHVRDYGKDYVLHIDRVDPRTDPMGHLLEDAPDELANLTIAGICAYGAGRSTYENSRGSDGALVNSLLVAGTAGLAGYAVSKIITSLLKD